jgi:hypothetical protein
MPRPKTKEELVHLSNHNFLLLTEYVKSLPGKDKNRSFPKGMLNRNIRDILAHLHHWHLLFIHWYEVGMKGGKAAMPAEGYTWKTCAELNNWIQKKYSRKELSQVIKLLNKSHLKVQKIIESHTNEELFTKKLYKWTGSTSLGSYLVGSTSSHYDWGLKIMKKALKTN